MGCLFSHYNVGLIVNYDDSRDNFHGIVTSCDKGMVKLTFFYFPIKIILVFDIFIVILCQINFGIG